MRTAPHPKPNGPCDPGPVQGQKTVRNSHLYRRRQKVNIPPTACVLERFFAPLTVALTNSLSHPGGNHRPPWMPSGERFLGGFILGWAFFKTAARKGASGAP